MKPRKFAETAVARAKSSANGRDKVASKVKGKKPAVLSPEAMAFLAAPSGAVTLAAMQRAARDKAKQLLKEEA